MKKLKNITAAKKLTILAIVILLIFVGMNISWAITKGFPYYGYVDKLNTTIEEDNIPEKDIDGYRFRADSPFYLIDYSGFLSVSAADNFEKQIDENGVVIDNEKLNIYLFIWPQTLGGYKYGVYFNSDSQEIYNQIMIDENMNYIPYDPNDIELKETATKLIAENHDEIKTLMDGAKNIWKLQGTCKDALSGMKAFVNNMPILTILILLFGLIGTLFIVINFIWLFRSRFPFGKFVYEMEKTEHKEYEKRVDGYIFMAEKPGYLRRNGFLTVKKEVAATEEDNISLIMYPKGRNGCKYRVCSGGKNTYSSRGNEDAFVNSEETNELKTQAKEFWGIGDD